MIGPSRLRASSRSTVRVADDLGKRLINAVQVVQLARASHARVGGKDLFGQGCARARKTDDKDRPRVGLAPADAASEELGCEIGDDLTDKLGMLIGVIGKASLRICRRIGEGWRFRAARRLESKARAGPDTAARPKCSKARSSLDRDSSGDQALHRLDIGVGQPAQQVGRQSPVGLGQIGTKRQRGARRLTRSLDIAALGVNRGERDPRDRHVRVEPDRLAKARFGKIELPFGQVREALAVLSVSQGTVRNRFDAPA